MVGYLAGCVDVGVGEALLGAAEEIRGSPAAVDRQQTSSHVSLGAGRHSWWEAAAAQRRYRVPEVVDLWSVGMISDLRSVTFLDMLRFG